MEIPSRLYAVSNFGSLAALALYPFVIEPALPLRTQLRWWSAGYAIIAALCVAAAAAAPQVRRPGPVYRPHWTWIVLPLCAVIVWLGISAHLTVDVAPVPLLWILPLVAYLGSFVAAFAHERFYHPRLLRWTLPLAWAGVCVSLVYQHTGGLLWRLAVCVGALFVMCLFCHGEVARRRPAAGDLAWFYVWIAAGGAAGSLFIALAAPRLFAVSAELPLGIALSMVLALMLVYGFASARRALRLGAVAVAALLFGTQYGSSDVARLRNFYGCLRVRDHPEKLGPLRVLYHGTVEHGSQFLHPERRRQPTAYYGPQSGGGLVLARASARGRRVGIIGLGAGTLAAYGQQGDTFRFYEINPLVVEVARKAFTYLADSAASIELVTADARVALEREPAQDFDVLILDAFSGDAIPVHLLTQEAFALYWRHLRPEGVLAAHITNKHLDLAPLVAAQVGAPVRVVRSLPDPELGTNSSLWVLAGQPERLRGIGQAYSGRTVRSWSDDYSSLFAVLR
jgi:hypothetical protein